MSDITSTFEAGYPFQQIEYTATLHCLGHPELVASKVASGGQPVAVSFPGTATWDTNCSVSQTHRVVAVTGIDNRVLWFVGGFVLVLVLIALVAAMRRRRSADYRRAYVPKHGAQGVQYADDAGVDFDPQ